MRTDRAVAILLGKELRAELRSQELLQTTLIFALIVVVLFSFAFDPTAAESRRFGPGLLWIAFLFAGTLMLNPSFAREQANDTLQALRMAPISAFALLLGKILANFAFLLAAELVLLPVFAVLYNVTMLPVIWRLLLVIVLGTLGIVVTGTVFAALASQARMRELLLPLLLLPVLAPLLIASVEATASLLNDEPALDPTWTVFLAAFDVVFLTASWLLCEHLIEE
jgi:heme exporter protein B